MVSIMEDIGFYCVDNLPASLIPKFAELCMANPGKYDRVAVVCDIRGGQTFDGLFEALEDLNQMGCAHKILFVEATPDVIIKRYKETRRSHPLAANERSLSAAVEKEITALEPVRKRAEYIIKTTALSTAKLRGEVLRIFGGSKDKIDMNINVISFGFKYGLPIEADLVFDVRFMPNPFYMEDLRPRTGLDQAVADYVFHFPQTQDYMRRLEDLLAFSLPLYAEEGKTSLTIAVGCTGGHHRSVAVTHALAGFIHGLGYQVLENHRDMTRGG